MVTRKRLDHPMRQVQVNCCFGCAALVTQNDRNHVSIFWADGDPGGDEIVTPKRASVVRMCARCREILQGQGVYQWVLEGVTIRLVVDTTNEKSKTGAHGIIPTRGTRRE